MYIALYNSCAEESQILTKYLHQCAREYLRPAKITVYNGHEALYQLVLDRPDAFDLLVVAEDGTFSLEVVDFLRHNSPAAPVLWFSDLDFAMRAYAWGVAWFGRKPVSLAGVRKAFARALESRAGPWQMEG